MFDARSLEGWPPEARELYLRRQRALWGDPGLAERLRTEIAASGPIPFAYFMREALYDPRAGYYASQAPRTGRQGDFLTSPSLHPAFGAALGELARRLWRAAGDPRQWTLLEMGAGRGELARDLLAAVPPRAGSRPSSLGRRPKGDGSGYPERFRYAIVEPFEAARRAQADTLAQALVPNDRVSWLRSLAEVPAGSVTGLLLSNELVDAFPVHRLRRVEGSLQETWVGAGEGGFQELWLEPSSDEVVEAALRLRPPPPEGQPFEVCLESRRWIHDCRRALGAGYVLTLDYGDEATRLYSGRYPQGTLMAYQRHGTANPLRAVGQHDITARVDFTALREAGGSCGLWSAPLATQRDLLLHLGWPPGALRGTNRAASELDEEESLRELVNPAGLGNVQVLLQGHGVDPVDPLRL